MNKGLSNARLPEERFKAGGVEVNEAGRHGLRLAAGPVDDGRLAARGHPVRSQREKVSCNSFLLTLELSEE